MPTTSTLAALAPDVVAAAVRAPSLHNAQPWRFRLRGDALEVRADRERQLYATDPSGRQLVLSCGAALFGARLALRGHDWQPDVQVRPDAADRDLLAVLRLAHPLPCTPHERALLDALPRRRTHRGRFEGPAVDPGLGVRLQDAAETEGARLLLVQRPGTRRAVADIVTAAERAQASHPDVRAELEDWTPPAGEGRPDGVPETAYARRPALVGPQDLPARDFAAGRERGAPPEVVLPPAGGAPPLIGVLATDGDGPAAWLAAGQALHRVLLTAAAEGVQAALSTSATERDGLRRLLQEELLVDQAPQMLLQLGHAPARDETGSPRRPVADVLERV